MRHSYDRSILRNAHDIFTILMAIINSPESNFAAYGTNSLGNDETYIFRKHHEYFFGDYIHVVMISSWL